MNIVEAITAKPVLSGATTLFVTIVGGIIIYEYKRRRQSIDKTKEWYAEAVGIIGRLQQAGQQITMFTQQIDEATLKSKFEPLAAELQSHAGNAPAGVEDQARVELIYLSTIASAIISLADRSEDESISTLFQEAQELANENSDIDFDLAELNDLFEPASLGNPEEQLAEADINEEPLREFVHSLSEESQQAGEIATTEDVLEMPIEKLGEAIADEHFWDQFVDDIIQRYIEVLLLDVSEEIYEAMEERK